jgi:hypothetical protein
MNTQGSMFADVGFSAGCAKGTLVAYDETLGIYVPAAAKWSKNYRKDGSVIPEPTSYVLGVLISDVVNNGGTVLTDGWTKDEELIQLLTGGVSGDYYLDSEGKAKPGRSNITTLPVYCFSYRKSADAGDVGVLVFRPQPPEYAGHSHGRYVLPADWSTASTGASLTLANSLAVFDALQKGNPECASLVKNGIEVAPDLWSIEVSDTVATISVKFAVLESDEFILHTITPFTAEEPIVRSVDTARNCEIFTADKDSGNVRLSLNEKAINKGRYTGTGLVGISNKSLELGPVVQQIHAGPGIALSQYQDIDGYEVPGAYIVSSEELVKQEHDMLLCNLDGAVMGSSSSAISYVFPKGITSKIHGSIRAPFIPKVLNVLTGEYVNRAEAAFINILVKGGAAGAQYLSLTANKIKKPQEGNGAIATNVESLLLEGSIGSDESLAYLLKAPVTVNSCDYIVCTLQANNPTSAIEVLSISLSLD